jgi:hypothetical protein
LRPVSKLREIDIRQLSPSQPSQGHQAHPSPQQIEQPAPPRWDLRHQGLPASHRWDSAGSVSDHAASFHALGPDRTPGCKHLARPTRKANATERWPTTSPEARTKRSPLIRAGGRGRPAQPGPIDGRPFPPDPGRARTPAGLAARRPCVAPNPS